MLAAVGMVPLLLLAGCHAPTIAPLPQVAQAHTQLQQIEVDATEAAAHLDRAGEDLRHNQPQAAGAEVQIATPQVRAIVPLVKPVSDELDQIAADRDAARLWIAQHHDDLPRYQREHENDWLGPRAHRWLRCITVIGTLLCVGYTCLLAAAEMQIGALAGLLHIIGHLLTFGLKCIGQAIGRLAALVLDRLANLGAELQALLQKASPSAKTN